MSNFLEHIGSEQQVIPPGSQTLSLTVSSPPIILDHASLGGVDLIHPRRSSVYRKGGKRAFDLALVLLAAPFLVVIVLLIAALVSADGAAPFYRHWRVGKDGKLFGCVKLRTMTTDANERLTAILASNAEAADEWAKTQKLRHDPRVTFLGLFLRKTSLDELPQFWNVIRGEMSFVGPRPVTLEELDRYGILRGAYLSVRPGITGPWQIHPMRNDMSYGARVVLDASYASSVNLRSDLKVIIETARWALHPNGC